MSFSNNLFSKPGIERSISLRSATTTDGFTVLANKHYTEQIAGGTLKDAFRNKYIDSHTMTDARLMRARQIAREIIVKKRQSPDDIPDETTEPNEASKLAKPDESPNDTSTPDKKD